MCFEGKIRDSFTKNELRIFHIFKYFYEHEWLKYATQTYFLFHPA